MAKVDAEGALRIHPEDARHLNVDARGQLKCISAHGEIQVVIELDDGMRRGVYHFHMAMVCDFKMGTDWPQLNLLISAEHCDPLSKTPYHKYVPIRLEKC